MNSVYCLIKNPIILNIIFQVSEATESRKSKKKIVRSKDPKQFLLPKEPQPKSKKKLDKTERPKVSSTAKKTRPGVKLKLKKVSRVKLIKKSEKISEKSAKSSRKGLPANSEVPDQLKWLTEDPYESLLSRFIETPKGTQLGESIGIERSNLIMKKKSKFYSIPLSAVKEKGDKLILKKKINWTAASKLGERWRKKTLDVIDIKKAKHSKVIKIE